MRSGDRRLPAHAALLAVVVGWASTFSVIKALLDHGFVAEDVALLRYLVAAQGSRSSSGAWVFPGSRGGTPCG